MLSARILLEEGIRKRVGDGEKITIWEEGKVKTARKPDCRITKVSEQIENGKWKEDLTEKIFDDTNKRSIMRIPLSIQKEKDRTY